MIAILIPRQYLFAEDSWVSKRIEGVADFLIERANENAICMFEETINKNPLIKEYFPNTSKMLETFDFKEIFATCLAFIYEFSDMPLFMLY